MPTRPPIPIPAHLRWREFRYRTLPMLTIGATFAAVVGLWVTLVDSPTIVGKALAKKANLVSPISGELLSLNVRKFEQVNKGETLAVIQPIGTKSQLDSLRLEIDIIRNQMEPAVEAKRNAVSYYRLRLEWLQQRVSLASSKVNLQRAQNRLARDKELFQTQLISADQFDQTQKQVDALVAEVNEADKMVAELEMALNGLDQLDKNPQTDELNERLQAALLAQESHLKRIEKFAKPYPLIAPISGKITSISRLPGETVMDGESILAITAVESTQLIAYFKPSLDFPFDAGTSLDIQTRGKNPRKATTQIEGISPAWESLGGSPDTPDAGEFSLNIGLPVLLTLPPELNVKPGELVDIFLPKP